MLTSFASLALVGCPSGGVGDPCIPEEEYLENFSGFALTEENIESRSFQCKTRLCLVNHFQGRVSCPKGQPPPIGCTDDAQCNQGTNTGETCAPAGVLLTDCDPTSCLEDDVDPFNCACTGQEPAGHPCTTGVAAGNNPACGGRRCDEDGGFCHCETSDCPAGYSCDGDQNSPTFKLCATKVCSKPKAEADEAGEQRCYVPGTDDPVAVPVCAQCDPTSNRHAEDAVYCSCRCGVAEGDEKDDNFNFCDCPEGFECKEIRKNVGLGDKQITGKYCVKQGTEFIDESRCGQVQGFWGTQCSGTPPGTSGS
jgi:hypothetical protein